MPQRTATTVQDYQDNKCIISIYLFIKLLKHELGNEYI